MCQCATELIPLENELDITVHLYIACKHFACVLFSCLFSRELKITRFSTLPGMKYTVTSHPFSKWDKLQNHYWKIYHFTIIHVYAQNLKLILPLTLIYPTP